MTSILIRMSIPLAAIAALLFLAAGPTGRAEAGPSVTGTWHVQVAGDLPGTCESIIIQDGNNLTSTTECSIVGTLQFTGTIDPATGSAVLTESSFGAVLNIAFADDGNSFTGAWSALGLGGTISGTRTSTDTTGIDISGDWTFVFEGRAPGDTLCDATLTQSATALTAVVTCPSGSETWTGTASPISGAINLHIDEPESYANIYASPSGDSSGAMSGSWSSGERESYGQFYAFPAGQPRPAILSIGCANVSGGTGYCYGLPGDTLTATVTLVAPPSDGYDGYQLALHTSGNVPYIAADDPATEAPGCTAVQRAISPLNNEMTITFTCAPGNAIDGASALVQIAFQCPDEPYAYTSLDLTEGGTFLSLGGAQSAPLPPWPASIDCYDPEEPPYPDPYPYPEPYPSLPPEAYIAADVDCNGQTNSIDAAFVLQLEAGLLDALPCDASGDATLDGSTNSIDATVILQLVAGLIAPPLVTIPVVAP
ncbi:MAG: hypothetical protein WEB04_08330 [Dehalococcoidia bacterium]